MKCNAYLKKELRGKKNPKLKTTEIYSESFRARNWPIPNRNGQIYKDEDFEVCDGDIIARVEAVNESSYGCCSCSTYAEFKVTYKCNKCGNEHFEELPQNSTEISKIVTDYISQMTDEQRKLILETKMQEEIKQIEESKLILEKFRREGEEREKQRQEKRRAKEEKRRLARKSKAESFKPE